VLVVEVVPVALEEDADRLARGVADQPGEVLLCPPQMLVNEPTCETTRWKPRGRPAAHEATFMVALRAYDKQFWKVVRLLKYTESHFTTGTWTHTTTSSPLYFTKWNRLGGVCVKRIASYLVICMCCVQSHLLLFVWQ
jgi:hypothetical protein